MLPMDEDFLLRNNTGNKSKQSIKEGFAVRHLEFDNILHDINVPTPNFQKHHLIIGQRGAGKTTLLYRLKYAIEDEVGAESLFLPIILSEEQYNLSELVNLWETIAGYLEDNYGLEGLCKKIDKIITDEKDYEPKVFLLLEERLRFRNKIVVLFIENINVFLKKIERNSLRRFKDVLSSSEYIRVVGASTSYSDGNIDFCDPFFDFFKVTLLQGLNRKECEMLLMRIGEQHGNVDQIKQIIQLHPGRVEALRRLTGGVPRTISYLFQIFLDNENGKAIRDLYILIDTLTFLYKAELDQLSAQQQKVLDVIARKWDAIPVKEIVKQTRFESKNISSILNALEKNQLIEIVHTDTKNHLYRIKERFMNIWYLMRFGRKHDKENIIWLVRFFDAWCDESELAKRIAVHIDNLKDGKYDITAAIDMGNTYLSCKNVSQALKLLLYKETKSILPARMLKNVRIPGNILSDQIKELVENREFEQAIRLLDQEGNNDKHHYAYASWVYLVSGDYVKSTEAAKKVLEIDSNDANAALTLGIIYEDYLSDIDQAEYYLKISLDQKHPYAASRLGDIEFKYKNDLSAAINYHLQAIKRGFKPSNILLGDIYQEVGDFDKAEKLYLQASKDNVEDAFQCLGKLYFKTGNIKGAKKSFDNALNLGEKEALAEIGILYRDSKRPDYDKAKHFFEAAISEGVLRAYTLLGDLYMDVLNEEELAIDTFKRGVNHSDSGSAHILGHYYRDNGDWEKSDSMFLKSVELGRTSAAICLIAGIYNGARIDKKGYALNLLKTTFLDIDNKGLHVKFWYVILLLWNDLLEDSLQVFSKAMPSIVALLKRKDDTRYDHQVNAMISQISNLFLLLIAKQEYKVCLSLFENESEVDFKTIIRPVYFALMECLKSDFPNEYLKAGDEYKDTMKEINETIIDLRTKMI
jgi:tetratricopeptide (TPR) repeat protein